MTMRDMRPMAVGEVLDRSFQVLRRHLGPLFVTAVLGSAPLLLIYLSAGTPYGATVSDEGFPMMSGLVVLFFGILIVSLTVSWAALTREIDNAALGLTVGFGDGLRRGFRRFFGTFFLAILLYLTGAAILVPAALVAALLAGAGSLILGSGVAAVALTVVSIVLALVGAGVLWAPLAFLGLPVLIAEDTGPLRALSRAHELGKGGRLRIVGTALVAWVLMVLPAIGIPFLFGFGLSLWNPSTAGTIPATQFYLYQAATFLIGGLTTPFMVAVMVYTYYDRRVRREGYDVELASESIPESV